MEYFDYAKFMTNYSRIKISEVLSILFYRTLKYVHSCRHTLKLYARDVLSCLN